MIVFHVSLTTINVVVIVDQVKPLLVDQRLSVIPAVLVPVIVIVLRVNHVAIQDLMVCV